MLIGPASVRWIRMMRGSILPALMLALAMGIVLAIFSLYEAVVLRPVSSAQRLISIGMEVVNEYGNTVWEDPSPEELKDLRQWPWLEGKPVQQDFRTYRVEAEGTTRSVLVSYASSNFFTTLGIQPAAGRLFAESDPEPGAVLSWSVWQRAEGTIPIGTSITVDGVSLPVLGVLPEGVQGMYPGYEPEVWVTLEARARSGEREARFLRDRTIGIPTFGRLRSGVSIQQAQAAFESLMAAWKFQRSTNPREMRAVVRPAQCMGEQAWGSFLPGSRMLWIAAIMLLLMAVLNLGNLQVARWMKERQAWFIRAALGASPARLARELGRPMLVALLLGSAGAFPVAWLIQNLIAQFPPPSEFPLVFRPQMHWGVFLLALGIVLLLALPLMAMAWIWFLRHSSHVDARNAMGGLRWRQWLLGTQIALSVLLLCGTLTSLVALRRAQRTPLGLDVRGLYAFSFAMPLHLPGGRPAIGAEWKRLHEHFRSVPGCQSTCVMVPPCEAFDYPPNAYRNSGGLTANALVLRMFPGTFALLKIPVLLGRDFSDTDTPESSTAAIVSMPLAQLLWPGQNPLGQTMEDESGRRCQVIGVVADHRWEGFKKTPHMPMIFLCGRQRIGGALQTLLIRSTMPEPQLKAWVEREVAMLDPRLSIERAEPLSARVDRMLQPQRLAATLFAMMGISALALCLAGLYALQHYLTVQRLQEAGLRMALGATPNRIRLEFLRSLRWPMGLGLSAGMIGTIAGWHLLGTIMTGLPALNFTALAEVVLGLLVTGLIAALLPLKRLDRFTPSDLLRDSKTSSQSLREE